jgi:hypothetical protein
MDPPGRGDQGEAPQPQPLEWRFAQVFGERAAGEDVQEGTHVRMSSRSARFVEALGLAAPMPPPPLKWWESIGLVLRLEFCRIDVL